MTDESDDLNGGDVDGLVSGAVPRLTPEMRRAQTRKHLIDAAAAVFAARGFHDASLAEVATVAGFTTGAIYSNFESKEDLFLAVVESRRATMFDRYFEPSDAGDAGERAERLSAVHGELKTSVAEWALWEEFTLYAVRNPDVRARLADETEQALGALVDRLRPRHDALGSAPPLPLESLARLYMALFDGLARQQAVQPRSVPDHLFADLVTFIEDALAP